MSTDFATTCQRIESAQWYGDIFTTADEHSTKLAYRRLMKTIHPDRVDMQYQHRASECVAALSRFYDEACGAVLAGTFGSRPTIAVLTSRRGVHNLTNVQKHTDMTNGYHAISTIDGDDIVTMIKVSTNPKDNDLLSNEALALKHLSETTDKEFTKFYPQLIDTFMIAEGRRRLQANTLTYMEGFYNLREVRHYRPDGLHPLDAAWMWRRMLWALGGVHDAGVIHGAVLPQHIIVHPKMHGVLLVDWCYSVLSRDKTYSPIKAIVGDCKSWYPLGVIAKKEPTYQVDLMMAARTVVYLLGGDAVSMTMPSSVPMSIQRYLVKITSGVNTGNAFELLWQFDELLQQLGAPYHPRRYREFIL